MRRRASSYAAAIRLREAASSDLLSALETQSRRARRASPGVPRWAYLGETSFSQASIAGRLLKCPSKVTARPARMSHRR
jgi:hypothetical protein